MLLNQGPSGSSASPGEISIRREGDWIKIGVDLGPDTTATHDLELRGQGDARARDQGELVRARRLGQHLPLRGDGQCPRAAGPDVDADQA